MFDQQDHELLTMVNEVLNRERSRKYLKNLFDPYLHPNGLKELAEPKEMRIAYAMINLLDTLQVGGAQERLRALRSVRDEVLHCARSTLRNNTGRVLLQIMKELVRAHANYDRQLELAHDFRTVSSGKPRLVRAQLRRYHLLEMPEEWNQLSFDDHIHDANTKGRKSPTHLIMDAWIKGIRSLTVIHYNHVPKEAAEELLQAAEIMGLSVRIGVEFSVPFRGRYVQFIWAPRGFSGVQDFLHFLEEPAVKDLMALGRRVSDYQQQYVFQILEEFNHRHRRVLNETYGLSLAPLVLGDFLSFVGAGQASLVHLGKFIHMQALPAMRGRMEDLRRAYAEAGDEERRQLSDLVRDMDNLDTDAITEQLLSPKANPGVPDPTIPRQDIELPRLLTMSAVELILHLNKLHAGFRITLNLSNLLVEDVIELLFDCRGQISHLELFNLKDYVTGKTEHIPEINDFLCAVNEGNIIRIKRFIRNILRRLADSDEPEARARIEKLHEVLHNIGQLRAFYKDNPLRVRLGSDSTGRSTRRPGMGLVIRDTLPVRAQRMLRKTKPNGHQTLPVRTTAYPRKTYLPSAGAAPGLNFLQRVVRLIPGLTFAGFRPRLDWVAENESTHLSPNGNIVSLGGVQTHIANGLTLDPPALEKQAARRSCAYLHTGLLNGLKVLIGFVPAFLTFYLTKDWWVLAWFGAVIWFGITGLRNIIQSVLGGGGLRRSSALGWKNYVSWERLADSLFYTGFSVPLLDYVVKTVVLNHGFNINASTNPLLLYTFMALANGVYISSHNLFRGLPKGAIYGNLFRSLLSIPLAVAFNSAIGSLLLFYQVPGVDNILQKWAAVISKAASDCVAGVIEGAADRQHNIQMRIWDYSGKLDQLFSSFARLELLLPEQDVLELLESPKQFIKTVSAEAQDLEKVVIINSLDLLYFWMYQPRARSVLKSILPTMSPEELQVLERSQNVLQRHKEISQMFVDGLVGKRFSRALSFYLDRSEEYLRAMQILLQRKSLLSESKPQSPQRCLQAGNAVGPTWTGVASGQDALTRP
jgi:hypothetical protein